MRRKRILRRIAASAVALSMMAALSAPAFAATFNISNGGLVIEANGDGSVTVWQDGCSGSSGSMSTVKSGEEIEITGSINMADSKYAPTSESLASNSEIYYPTTEKEAEEPDTEEPKTQEKADEPAAEEQQTQEKAEEPAAEEQQTQKKAEGKKEASASAEATATASAGVRVSYGDSSRIRTGVIEIINNTVNKLKLTFNNVTVQQEKVAGSGGGGAAGVDVAGNGDVEIELKGKNTIKGTVGHAGIEKDVTKDASGSTITNGGGTLTITAKDTNQTLYAEGGSGGAGIGSGQYRGSAEVSDGEKVSCGTGKIVISGGKIEAVGGPGATMVQALAPDLRRATQAHRTLWTRTSRSQAMRKLRPKRLETMRSAANMRIQSLRSPAMRKCLRKAAVIALFTTKALVSAAAMETLI